MVRARRFLLGLAAALTARATSADFQLPAFPLPALVFNGGPLKELTPVGLLRELHRGGVHRAENFETADADYALLRSDSVGLLATWLETACRAVGFDLQQARTGPYDGTIFARIVAVATSLAALREGNISLAMPIGVLICERGAAWGDLPADGAPDAYLLFATEAGMLVYDPPTRQVSNLAEFPNKARILRIRF